MTGPRVVHLDIVDYPGEWLLDLALLEKSYDQWSSEVLDRIAARPQAAAYLEGDARGGCRQPLDEATAQRLAQGFTAYLTRRARPGSTIARRAGSCCPAIWPARPS